VSGEKSPEEFLNSMNESEFSLLGSIFGSEITDGMVRHYYRPTRGFACGAKLIPRLAEDIADNVTCPNCWKAMRERKES